MLRLLLLVLALSFAARTGTAQSAPGEPADLAAFIPAEADLPADCAPRALDDTAPPFMTTNPRASDDPSFVEPVGYIAFRGTVPADSIRAALMGAYDSVSEVGILAYRFTGPRVATLAREVARTNDVSQDMVMQGATLAMVWRDGAPNPCFQALLDHVRAVMAASEAPAPR